MKNITIKELKQMRGKEGLILQGCGGDTEEWIDGINELFTNEKILKEGDIFEEVYKFENEGLINLLFDMENVNLDVGRLAVWRIVNHDVFGGTWLDDYLDNQLGMKTYEEQDEVEKLNCELMEQDMNITFPTEPEAEIDMNM